MKTKIAVFSILSAIVLATWTAFGFYEGRLVTLKTMAKQIPVVKTADNKSETLAGKQLYCLSLEGISPCVLVAHNPDNETQVLLAPQDMLNSDDDSGAPDQGPK